MVLTPVLVLLIVLGIQLAVYFHAANVASAAAGEGASAGGAAEAAARTVAELGSSLAAPPRVTDDGAFIVVSVEVSVPSLLPGFDLSVTRTVRVPRERFVDESDR